MPYELFIQDVVTVVALLVVAVTFGVFVLPLHPSLPGWKAWYECREAEERAERLLKRVLGDAEYESFILKGYVEVSSRKYPGRVYQIRRWPEKVTVVENGRTVGLLCAEPVIYVPSADQVLTLKLLIEDDEELYLRIANKIP